MDFNLKNLSKKTRAEIFLGLFLLAGGISGPIYSKTNSDKNLPVQAVQIAEQVTGAIQSIEVNAPEIKREMVPIYYSQNDDRWREYKYSMYGEPTWRYAYAGGPQNIGRSGCVVAATAMALSTLTEQAVTPPIVADYSVDNGFRTYDNGTYMSLIPNISNYYGVDCYSTDDFVEVIDTLKNNKNCVALVTMSPGSHFTRRGHCLMLTGAELHNDYYNWFTVYDSNTYSMPDGPYGELYVNNPNYTVYRPTSWVQLTETTGVVEAQARLVNAERNSSFYILSRVSGDGSQ